ncbi:MAG: DNA-processing protein DprA [Candidatus Ratteibacteria bacterium]
MSETKKCYLCAALAGLGSVGAKKLTETYGSIENISHLSVKELREMGIPLKTANNVVRWETLPWKEELRFCEKNNITLVSIADDDYPHLLKETHSPPLLLYVKGTLPSAKDICIAIVGTRTPSVYGLRTAEKLAGELSLYGITIVSGLARGIDTAAHKGALKTKGKTLAVTGCGFRHFYPKENLRLSEEIAKTGAVITEFPSYITPRPSNFPQRNRIVSGICRGTLVVEAGQKSGALITANFALEQGREVLAIPGRTEDLTSKGTNRLLKEGALLVENVMDIIDALNLELKKTADKKETNTDGLTTTEKTVLNSIHSGRQTNIDEIALDTGIQQSLLFQVLLSLITKELISELPGKFYTRK